MKISEAVIICGGEGSRLRENGVTTPKSLLRMGNKSIIDIQIEELLKIGIMKIHLALGKGGKEIESHIRQSNYFSNAIFEFHNTRNLLGTGGSLVNIHESLSNCFLVIYGDVLFEIDWEKIIYSLNEFDFCILTRRSDHPEDSDLLEIDYQGRVIDFHAKPHSQKLRSQNIACTGLFVLRKTALIYLYEIFKEQAFHLDRQGVPRLIESKLVVARRPITGYVKDVGTIERLKKAEVEWTNRSSIKKEIPAVFLDRDGTLNELAGYISTEDELKIFPDVPEGIKCLRESGYMIFVVTNQPVVARGMASERVINLIHYKLEDHLKRVNGSWIDEILYCPHHPDAGFVGEIAELKVSCTCRKPKADLVERALAQYPINRRESWVVGDSWRDYELAKNSSMRFCGVRNADLKTQGHLFFRDLIDFGYFLKDQKAQHDNY